MVCAESTALLLVRTVAKRCTCIIMTLLYIALFRLPTDHPSLTKWSAPLFVDISLQGGGLAFGKQERSAFSVCTTGQLEQILFNTDNPGTRSFGGIEFAFSCGNAVSEKTDVVSIPFGSELDLITVSRQSGAIMGFSFLCTCCCISLSCLYNDLILDGICWTESLRFRTDGFVLVRERLIFGDTFSFQLGTCGPIRRRIGQSMAMLIPRQYLPMT